MSERITLFNLYAAFKSGAGLRREDVAHLLASRGLRLSSNRINEFSRRSDRGSEITIEELYLLISAWADREKAKRASQ